MGLETLLLVALAATAGAAAGGAFSSAPKKPRFPIVPSQKKALRGTRTKIKSEADRAKQFLASRDRRGGSREASQIIMPGFLDPAQVKRPGLADVLG
ncbi:hypothetical protein LCGC14_2384090 [marine sediment metagenome]|uniref:Uncharacterized protein n=1 Tax=marine sediment metagenome TaxID=412755 RepID=A0A0F9ECF2_9ZZZZ